MRSLHDLVLAGEGDAVALGEGDGRELLPKPADGGGDAAVDLRQDGDFALAVEAGDRRRQMRHANVGHPAPAAPLAGRCGNGKLLQPLERAVRGGVALDQDLHLLSLADDGGGLNAEAGGLDRLEDIGRAKGRSGPARPGRAGR